MQMNWKVRVYTSYTSALHKILRKNAHLCFLDIIYIVHFDPDNLANSNLILDLNSGTMYKIDLDQKPELPRINFSLAGTAKYQLYIFGGAAFDGTLSNNLDVFDINQYQWTKIETRGTPPSPMQGHSAIVIDNNMFVFGKTKDQK